jgi:hypothetical protein
VSAARVWSTVLMKSIVSAFVGLAVMLVLLPVPAKVASLMSGLQAAKMSAVSWLHTTPGEAITEIS